MRSKRKKTKPKSNLPTDSLFNRRVSKLKTIEALLHECSTLEQYAIIDDAETEDVLEEDTSILVKSTKAKKNDPTDIHNLIFAI